MAVQFLVYHDGHMDVLKDHQPAFAVAVGRRLRVLFQGPGEEGDQPGRKGNGFPPGLQRPDLFPAPADVQLQQGAHVVLAHAHGKYVEGG